MIYIVEDDAAIRELEQYALQSSGYEVTSFESSEPFWQAMHAAEPELVILDVMLPGEDGFSILKKLRNTPSLRRLPIIMVTAKSSELDTVRGLDCGADDYISKPFGIMEFLSRVRAALRRSAPEARPNVHSFHEIRLDNARHNGTVSGTPVELTYKEYSLLRLLLENRQGRVSAKVSVLEMDDGFLEELPAEKQEFPNKLLEQLKQCADQMPRLYQYQDGMLLPQLRAEKQEVALADTSILWRVENSIELEARQAETARLCWKWAACILSGWKVSR